MNAGSAIAKSKENSPCNASKKSCGHLVERILSSSWSTVGFRRLMRPSVNASRVGFSQKSSILSSMDVLSLAVSTSMSLTYEVRWRGDGTHPWTSIDRATDAYWPASASRYIDGRNCDSRNLEASSNVRVERQLGDPCPRSLRAFRDLYRVKSNAVPR